MTIAGMRAGFSGNKSDNTASGLFYSDTYLTRGEQIRQDLHLIASRAASAICSAVRR